MGLRITDAEVTALYDSVSDVAFGPVFYGGESEAETFLQWLEATDGRDARAIDLNVLGARYGDFRRAVTAHLGHDPTLGDWIELADSNFPAPDEEEAGES